MRQRLVSVACIAALVAPVAATVRQRRFGRRQGEGKMRAAFTTLLTSLLFLPALAVAQNTPPVADAGPDQSVFVGEAILLQGSATDPDGDFILGWQWAVESAPVGSTPYISEPTTADPVFVAYVAGEYVLSLVASDGSLWSAPDTVLIDVSELLPPVAVIGAAPTSGPAPLMVSFDSSQSVDNIGDGLSFSWSFGDGSAGSSEAQVTHEYVVAGTFTVSLTVIDSYGQSDTDTVVIHVLPATNTPPVADAGPDQSVQVNVDTSLQGSGTDAENDPIVGWAWAVESSAAGSTPVLGSPDALNTTFVADVVGDYVISLVVSDGLDFSEPDFVTVTVFDILPPVAVATADVTSGPAPLTVHFDGSASTVDPRGGSLSYFWNFGDGNAVFDVAPSHEFIDAGTYLVRLTVSDSLGQMDVDTISILTIGDPWRTCGRAIAKAGTKFAKARAKVLGQCELKKVQGTFPAQTICQDDPTVQARLDKATTKFERALDKKCGGNDKVCNGDGSEPSPAGLGFPTTCPNFENTDPLDEPACSAPTTDCHGLAECLACIDAQAVDQAVDLVYADLLPSTPGDALNTCQVALGKDVETFMAQKAKVLAKCWELRLKGTHSGICPDATAAEGTPARQAADKITKLATVLDAKLCTACGGTDRLCNGVGDLTPGAITLATECPAVTIPGGPSCGGSLTTLQDLVDCVACVAEFKVDCMVAATVPAFVAYPAECNP